MCPLRSPQSRFERSRANPNHARASSRHPQSRSPYLPLPGERQTHACPMSHGHQRLLGSCPPSSRCPAFPPPLRPPRSVLDSTAISDKTSRYRSVLRRRQPEGNPWRGLGPGHGTGYVPRPVRPSSHSALLGKPPPTEAHRCTLALPAVRARRLPLAREFGEPGPRVFLCLSPCVPCSLAPILSPSIVYRCNYYQDLPPCPDNFSCLIPDSTIRC